MAYDKVIDSAALDAQMTELADAIRAKAGTNSDLEWVSGFKSAVESIQTGGGGAPVHVEEKDVNFWDYDGTLLHSYTLAEAQALAELPPLPTREGLICQGWNWTLADLKAYAKPNDIMPFYITEDGATWFDLENDLERDVTVTFRWTSKGQAVTLDFGDGSEPYVNSTAANGSVVTVTHTYTQGSYRAKLSGVYNTGAYNVVSDVSDSICATLKRVFLGTYPTHIGDYCFRACVNLETCTIRNTIVCTGGQAFNRCYHLKALVVSSINVTIPSTYFDDCTSLKVISFQNGIKAWYGALNVDSLKRICIPDTCTKFNLAVLSKSLNYINIPDGVTALPGNAVRRNYSLTQLIIPSSVTTIAAQAIQQCTALMVLRFLPTTPPTVANANAFSEIPTNCIVEVPAASLEAYQNATNYSGIAAQMIGV